MGKLPVKLVHLVELDMFDTVYFMEGVGGRGLGAVEARTCVLSNTSRRPQKLSQEQNHGLERPRNVLKKMKNLDSCQNKNYILRESSLF